MMTKEEIAILVATSLLSGLVGVLVSAWYYGKLERRRIKIDTARKLFGNKHNVSGQPFQEAMNEAIVVFADSKQVVADIKGLFDTVAIPQQSRAADAADAALIKLMKSICSNIGIKYRDLPDSYYLKYFTVPPNAA